MYIVSVQLRKTGAICVAKLFDVSPELVQEQGLLDLLRALLHDNNAMVCMCVEVADVCVGVCRWIAYTYDVYIEYVIQCRQQKKGKKDRKEKNKGDMYRINMIFNFTTVLF